LEARYTRIFTDEHGVARFDEVAIELHQGFAVPPADPLHFAPFLATDGSFWIGGPTTWKGGEAHTAPRRQIFVTVRGEYQVTAGDNEKRSFPAGSVLVIEDTTGSGHSTKIIGTEDAIVFAVGLPPQSAG
jgi:hypothetical protein